MLCARIANQDFCARCHHASKDGGLPVAGRLIPSNAAHYARAADIISPVHIEASAPTRIDLAGGTLDIWPLYLFHERRADAQRRHQPSGAVFHPARAPTRRSASSRGIPDGASMSTHWCELRDNHELRLLGRLLHYFQADGIELPDAVRIAGRGRHRRFVGAQHRRVRRARGR